MFMVRSAEQCTRRGVREAELIKEEGLKQVILDYPHTRHCLAAYSTRCFFFSFIFSMPCDTAEASHHTRLYCRYKRVSSVVGLMARRRLENTMPALENNRSTSLDVEGVQERPTFGPSSRPALRCRAASAKDSWSAGGADTEAERWRIEEETGGGGKLAYGVGH
jgi:hypothetical protein